MCRSSPVFLGSQSAGSNSSGRLPIISSDLTPTWTARSTSDIMSFSVRFSHGSLVMPLSLSVVNRYLSASHSRGMRPFTL